MSLRDAEGNAAAMQLSQVERHRDGSIRKARVSFYAALPADGEMRYVLSTSRDDKVKPSSGGMPVKVDTAGNGEVTLRNGFTAVRLPAGRSRLAKPVPLVHIT